MTKTSLTPRRTGSSRTLSTVAERRFERFDKITVRAATRLLRLASQTRLSEGEINCYVSELVALQPRTGLFASDRLKRLARWRAAMAAPGTATRNWNRRHTLASSLR